LSTGIIKGGNLYRIQSCIVFVMLISLFIFQSGQAQLTELDFRGYFEMEPKNPQLGNVVTLFFTLEAPTMKSPEFRVEWKLLEGAELVRGNIIEYHQPLAIGDRAQFSIDIRITARILHVRAVAYGNLYNRYSRKEWGIALAGSGTHAICLAENDTISYEKFGYDLDLWSQIGPEYQYDIEAGVRIPPMGRPFDKEARRIREQTEALKAMDPTLDDWEALEILHEAHEDMVWRYGIYDEDEAKSILIQARQLAKEKGLSKWDAVDEIINQRKSNEQNDGGSRIFFRSDRDVSGRIRGQVWTLDIFLILFNHTINNLYCQNTYKT
jgi:hypothetical protein